MGRHDSTGVLGEHYDCVVMISKSAQFCVDLLCVHEQRAVTPGLGTALRRETAAGEEGVVVRLSHVNCMIRLTWLNGL